MKDLFERSVPMQETAQTKKGLLWILELLVFVAVFLVASIAQGFATVPMQLVMLFSDKAYMAAVASGDVAKLTEVSMEVTQRLMESDGYMIGMLLSDIVMMLIVFLFCRFIQKRKLRTLGFIKKGMLKEYGLGMLLGFAFFSVCVLLGVLFGGLKIEGISPEFSIGIFVAYLLGYMVQGMTEEVLCRGYFLGSYARRYPVYAAVLANSLLFVVSVCYNRGISVLAFIHIYVVWNLRFHLFSFEEEVFGESEHFYNSIWNLVQGNFYGIKVSGTPVGNTLFTTQAIAGKSLWNGGDFGMEGSLICTIVLTCGIIFLYTRKNKDAVEA